MVEQTATQSEAGTEEQKPEAPNAQNVSPGRSELFSHLLGGRTGDGGPAGAGLGGALGALLGMARAPQAFKVHMDGVMIECGPEGLSQAVKAVRQHKDDMTAQFANQLGNELMEKMKPYMPPEQRARGEAATEEATGPDTEEATDSTPERETVPVKRNFRLSQDEVAGYDLLMECVGDGNKMRAVIEKFVQQPNLMLTRREMVQAGIAKNERSATSVVAQIRNKCANSAEISPEKVIFKDVNTNEWCMHERFAEYLRRRSDVTEE